MGGCRFDAAETAERKMPLDDGELLAGREMTDRLLNLSMNAGRRESPFFNLKPRLDRPSKAHCSDRHNQSLKG
jgi:hypothetical protein